MARYTSDWSQIPLEQYAALPEHAQQQIDARVAQLLDEPERPPTAYDPPTAQWTTVDGDDAGLIL